MKLSLLQKFILIQSLLQDGKVERGKFREFYRKQEKKTKINYQENIITKSMEHLIDRELLIGYGRRTPHRWFVTHVRLTAKGRRQARKILREKQKKLPLK